MVGAGVAAFVVAVFAHAAKLGGFAVIADRAGARIAGDSASLQEQLIIGKFASFQTVIFRYLEGNDITLIKNFGIPLGLFVLVSVLALMDKRIIWYLGPDRRKLQILALAFLASLAAPLSWFVLAKAHSFVHPPIDFILWYLPTIPLGGALLGGLAAPIVARRGLDLGVPGELLDGAEVGAGVEQIADERPSQVMWRKGCHAGLHGSTARDVQHGLPRHPPLINQSPPFVDGHEQSTAGKPRTPSQASSAARLASPRCARWSRGSRGQVPVDQIAASARIATVVQLFAVFASMPPSCFAISHLLRSSITTMTRIA